MSEVIAALLSVLPLLLAILVPLMGIIWVVVGSRATWVWVCLYFAFIFYFPNASWGIVNKAADANFYNKATGTFFFSAINLLLFGLVVQTMLSRAWSRKIEIQNNLRTPALMFWLILLGNVLIGGLASEARWFEIIGYAGLLNIANFMLAFYILVSCIRSPQDLDKVINVLLFCAITRGLWGLVRFIALGGDPANFYANYEKLDVKLTFFDINDGLVATLALFIAAWRLATEKSLSVAMRLAYWSIVGLELFIIVFSYRRTAWGGLALAVILFAFCQPRRMRISLLLGFFAVGLPALGYKMLQRSALGASNASLLERLFPDIAGGGQLSFTTGRFAELYAAYLSFKESPWIGLGTWGRYDGSRFSELAWHNGDFGWMHSGVMHIALKSGLLGVAISIAAFVGLLRHVRLFQGELSPAQRGLMMAGLAGVLFMLPNWLIGTPVIEYRTMQLMAFSFALPYMAHTASTLKKA